MEITFLFSVFKKVWLLTNFSHLFLHPVEIQSFPPPPPKPAKKAHIDPSIWTARAHIAPLPSPPNTPHHHRTRSGIHSRLSGGLPIFCTCRNNTGTTVFRNSWHSRAVRMTHLSGPLQASDSGAPSHRWGVVARRAEALAYWFTHHPCCSLSVSLGAAVSSLAARRDAVTSHHIARPYSGLNGRVALRFLLGLSSARILAPKALCLTAVAIIRGTGLVLNCSRWTVVIICRIDSRTMVGRTMTTCRILVIFMGILTTSMVMGRRRTTLSRGRVLLLYQVIHNFFCIKIDAKEITWCTSRV